MKPQQTLNYARLVIVLSLLAFIVGGSCLCARSFRSTPAPKSAAQVAPVRPSPAPQRVNVATQPAAAHVTSPSRQQLALLLKGWVAGHADRHGQQKLRDIFPGQPIEVTVKRFGGPNAYKFSTDPTQWSQFLVDDNRDGVPDEKWLIIYRSHGSITVPAGGFVLKREKLDANGRTVGAPEYVR